MLRSVGRIILPKQIRGQNIIHVNQHCTESEGTSAPTLLCVANFPSSTGFAWKFIESIYASIADRLCEQGIRTLVAYPTLDERPQTLEGSTARPVEQEIDFGRPGSLIETLRLVRRNEIRMLYLSDRPAWHPAFPLLRAAGVRWIVVHDHTSGARCRPRGLKRAVKHARHFLPGTLADRVVAVSDYVLRRKIDVDLVPPERVVRIWNAIQLPGEDAFPSEEILKKKLGIAAGRQVVACACRAAPEKGVQHLLRAFDRLARGRKEDAEQPVLVYIGSGPAMERWEALRRELSCTEDVLFTGYREDAEEIVGAADVAVVPSVWEEAFGLAALEPMARGVPVVASAVGGLPEVVEDGETGILVQAGDEVELANALHSLLDNGKERERMGRNGRERARKKFSWEEMVSQVTGVLTEGLRQ